MKRYWPGKGTQNPIKLEIKENDIIAKIDVINESKDTAKTFKAIRVLSRKTAENPYVHDAKGRSITPGMSLVRERTVIAPVGQMYGSGPFFFLQKKIKIKEFKFWLKWVKGLNKAHILSL